MPGLIRGMARTAAVVGTAGAVNHHQQRKWGSKDQQAAGLRPTSAAVRAAAQQYAAPPPQYAPAAYESRGRPDGREDQPAR